MGKLQCGHAPLQQPQTRERGADGGGHHEIDIRVLQKQATVDGAVVAETAGGEQEAEAHADGERQCPRGGSSHSRPPVRACSASVTTTATPKKTAVVTKLAGDRAEHPEMPWPDVHPPAHRAP